MTTVHECVQRIIYILCGAGQKVIVWPTAETIPQISHEFQSLGGIPGVIGAVDGCHIHIKAPSETQADYIDRNQRHSVNLMAVCTTDNIFLLFRLVSPGQRKIAVFKSCQNRQIGL